MGKVICDICGTSYPETEDFCPICGCSQDVRADMDMELEDEDFLLDSPIVTARQRKEAEQPRDDSKEEPEDDEEDEEEEDEEEEPRRRGTGLVIILVILIMLLLAAAGFLFLRYVLPNMITEQTLPTDGAVQTEEPVQTTTEPGIPCQQLILTSGGVVELTREGEYRLINVIVKPSDTTDELTYTSSDETVVTVNKEGRITGLAEGEAVVTIACGDQKIECRVKVQFVEETEPPTEETAEPEAEETEEDADTQSDETEAAPAETEQTQPQEEEAVPETEAQLKDVTLKLAKSDFSMGVGYQYTIPLDCDLSYEEIEWSTGNAGIATIKDGVITTLSRGTTQLFAKYGDQTVTGWIRVK